MLYFRQATAPVRPVRQLRTGAVHRNYPLHANFLYFHSLRRFRCAVPLGRGQVCRRTGKRDRQSMLLFSAKTCLLSYSSKFKTNVSKNTSTKVDWHGVFSSLFNIKQIGGLETITIFAYPKKEGCNICDTNGPCITGGNKPAR